MTKLISTTSSPRSVTNILKRANELLEGYYDSKVKRNYTSRGSVKLTDFKKVRLTPASSRKYKEKLKPFMMVAHYMKGDKGYYYLDRQGDVVAILAIVPGRYKTWWIAVMEVNKKYQGYGLARQLLDVGTKQFKATHLEVEKNNKLAVRLYKRYGFEIYDEKQYGSSGGNMWLMKLS